MTRLQQRAVLVPGAALVLAACGGTTTPTPERVPGTVVIGPVAITLAALGDSVRLTAQVLDANGAPLDTTLTWTSSAAAVVSVDATGLVTGLANGSAVIHAVAGTAADSVSVTVAQVVTRIGIAAPGDRVLVDDTIRLAATARDRLGNAVAGVPVSWTSTDTTFATIDAAGLVTGRVLGTVEVVAQADGVSQTFPLTVVEVFASASTQLNRTCALTTRGTAYCWGENLGTLGAGTGLAEPMTVPVRVVHPGTFQQVAAGDPLFSCGLDAAGLVWCWGSNIAGGIGVPFTRPLEAMPIRAQTATVFDRIDAGMAFACARAPSGGAECWGSERDGRLGNGRDVSSQAVPGPVLGGITFATVRTGLLHSACGLDIGGAAYCWGTNQFGALGDTTVPGATTPIAVTGGLAFSTIDVGGGFACGVETGTGTTYCWGLGGRLGDGTSAGRGVPGPVSGGLAYTTVSAGYSHACALTAAGAAYCWGDNGGQLGDGTMTQRLVPTAVTGGLSFRSISAGTGTTCGITTDEVLYCWGQNGQGQLGDGTRTTRTVPTRVLFQR